MRRLTRVVVGFLLIAAVLSCTGVAVVAPQEVAAQEVAVQEVTPQEVTGGGKAAPKRYAMVIHLKPEKLEYYKRLHADPWPDVLEQMERSNIHNFSINLVELREGEYTLFGYFEYTGDDFDGDMAAMADDPETQRWWKETGPCQFPIATAEETLGENSAWHFMEEIFYAP